MITTRDDTEGRGNDVKKILLRSTKGGALQNDYSMHLLRYLLTEK